LGDPDELRDDVARNVKGMDQNAIVGGKLY
jgi:hypothetical protein